MVGIFDSGIGGLISLYEYRRISPTADILYLADRYNAPYGTKSEEELISLVENDIEKLASLGAEKVLMACCTASTVHQKLSAEKREISIPIIAPASRKAAQISKNGNIAVIATERTVKSHAFRNEIKSILPTASVTELAVQRLVSLIENGSRDGKIDDEARRETEMLLSPLSDLDIDTVILGCTHFTHLKKEISNIFPAAKLVSSADEGAYALAEATLACGLGRTVYL